MTILQTTNKILKISDMKAGTCLCIKEALIEASADILKDYFTSLSQGRFINT